MSQPLTNVRVLDLTRLLPGGLCTMMLADLGAEIIKVEDPNGGDYARWMGPQIDGQSVFFRMNNRNKKSIILNLKEEDGQAMLKKLVATADVLVEGFRPGVMSRLNCDYDTLKAINPKLVYCALSGWGADGPYAQSGNHDLNYVSIAGLTGFMENPQVMGGQVADIGGAYIGVAGILAGLYRAELTGEGGFVDASLAESALPFAMYNWVEAKTMGATPGKGMLSGGVACYRVYQTKDERYASLGALEDKFWRNFCHAVDRPDLIDGYLDPSEQDSLIDTVSEIFMSKTLAEWDAHLSTVDCCYSPVKTPDEIEDDPQFKARGMLGTFEDGTAWMRSPIRLSGSTPQIDNVVPDYGEHTDEILASSGSGDDEKPTSD